MNPSLERARQKQTPFSEETSSVIRPPSSEKAMKSGRARSSIGTLRDDIYELFLTTLHAPLSTDLMPAKRNWHDAVVLAPRSGTGLRKQTGYSRAFSVFIPLSSDLLPLFHLVSDAKRTFENALSLWFSTTTNTNCFIISLLNLCLSASANRESPDASASFSILLFWKNGILI